MSIVNGSNPPGTGIAGEPICRSEAIHKESESHAEPHCEHILKERNDEQNIESNGGADRKLLTNIKKHLQKCRYFFVKD